jgi:hypothetical protein
MSAASNTSQPLSKAEQYAISKGWDYHDHGDQISVSDCPISGCDDYKFYMAKTGNKDGLWDCKKCCQSGNLYQLMQKLGDRMGGVQSQQEWASGQKKVDSLPNVEHCHRTLLENQDAMDYLIAVRGYTSEVIQEQKLGYKADIYFPELKREAPGIVIPYLQNDHCVFAKYRSLPPAEKAFSAPSGWDAPLYNQQIIKHGIEELIFVEGEADALALMSKGIKNVVGVPGAGLKKTTWVTLIDEVAPKRIYILYDRDKTGQKGAQELAGRIGLDKCLNLQLPAFQIVTDDGEEHPGKDVNEWFRHGGGTVEEFEVLKRQARQFDVNGVKNVGEALDELEKDLEGKKMLKPTYESQWDAFNSKGFGAELGDVIDVLAKEKVGKSTWALNLLDHVVAKYGEVGLFVCLEMSQKRLARKWVSYITQTDDSRAKNDDEAREKLAAMKAAIPIAKGVIAERKGDLLFAYPQYSTPEDIYDLIKQAVRRYGVKWVVLDNIQLLCDSTLKNLAHRTVHLSQISKNTAKLAKDLNVVMVRILQPKKVNKGDIVDPNDIDGSSQIPKDCDLLTILHRKQSAPINAQTFENVPFLDEDGALEPEMLAAIRLSRYSGGGITTLIFEGSTSTVRDFTPADRTKMKVNLPPQGNTVPTEAAFTLPGTAQPTELKVQLVKVEL